MTYPSSTDEDDAICPVCGAHYALPSDSNSVKKTWIGCEGHCGQWFHCKCAGYKRMPAKKTSFICSECKQL